MQRGSLIVHVDCAVLYIMPLNLALLGFALGVGWLQCQAQLPTAMLLGSLAVLCSLLMLMFYRHQRQILALGVVCAFCAVLGASYATWRAQARLADRLSIQLEGVDLVLTGVVCALPVRIERGVRFEFEVESMRDLRVPTPQDDSRAPTTLSHAVGVPQRVRLTWYQPAAGSLDATPDLLADRTDGISLPRVGERWQLPVRLRRVHSQRNPGGMDYTAWLFAQGIGATGVVRSPQLAQRLGVRWTWRDGIERLRASIRDRFTAVLGQTPAAAVLIALVIGEQRAIDPNQWWIFNRTGVTHLMSISGLHVTMVAALCAWFVTWCWRCWPRLTLGLPARKAGALAAVMGAWCYTLLAGFGVPAQRTFFMLASVAIAMWLSAVPAAPRVLLLAMAVVLLIDPWAVLAPGFWLSFTAVALIFYVTQGWFVHTAPNAHWIKRLQHSALQWAQTQWAITLGLAPASLLLFSQISLVAPFANAIAIPWVSVVVTPLALLAAIVPVDALLQLTAWLMQWLIEFLTWCAWWPWAMWQHAAPAGWAVCSAALGVVLLLAPRGVPGRWAGVLLLVPVLWHTPARPPAGVAWVRVLDVGQGLAVLVQTAHHALLYDAGPQIGNESDSGERVIVPHLQALGETRLDTLLLSHDDLDHSGGAIAVLEQLHVDTVVSSLTPDHPVLAFAPQSLACERGMRWQWDGVVFEVLHPTAQASEDRVRRQNNRSCVLRIDASGARMLLTGDIEAQAEASLVADYGPTLHAQVLLAPHHGSRTSSTPTFLTAVKPQWVLVSAGYRNRFGHPRAEIVARYRDHGAKVLRTDHDGAIDVQLGAQGVTLATQRQLHARYWHPANE